MRRKKWFKALNRFLFTKLECIRQIIVSKTKTPAYKFIDKTINKPFRLRIVDHLRPLDPPASKYAIIISLHHFTVELYQIARIVTQVSHHDSYTVSRKSFK